MRSIVLAAAACMALAPAVPAFAADKGDKTCHDDAGRVIACPAPDKNEVNVAATHFNKPETGPINKRPDLAIPPMATAVCRDGAYYNGTQPGAACDAHGGVAQWLR